MPLFHSALPRAIFFGVVLVWVFFEVRQSVRTRPEATVVSGGSRRPIAIAYVVGLLAADTIEHNVRSLVIHRAALSTWGGLVIMCTGVILRVWCFRTLGSYFTFTVQTSEDQRIIATGPYRVLRHPSYAALLLIFIGWGFVNDNWGSLVVLTAAVATGLVLRIRVEERALSQDLGERYQAFAATKKRLIPFVW
jgi:protein-S-isoprenylcysteine O-methyltransferase Ste14